MWFQLSSLGPFERLHCLTPGCRPYATVCKLLETTKVLFWREITPCYPIFLETCVLLMGVLNYFSRQLMAWARKQWRAWGLPDSF